MLFSQRLKSIGCFTFSALRLVVRLQPQDSATSYNHCYLEPIKMLESQVFQKRYNCRVGAQ